MKHNIENTVFSVINAIPNPVIITSNDKLQSVNNTFLRLVGLTTISEFNTLYNPISDLFVKNNGFFSPADISEDMN